MSYLWKIVLVIVAGILFLTSGYAQPDGKRISREEYILKWKDVAVRHMEEYGIPASITLAQGILESGYGNSKLARYANNHFGIKCHRDWNGRRFHKDDDKRDECFRSYYSAEESFSDHAEFLANRSRYDLLFEQKLTDYKGWARGLKKAGYATNPEYPELLIRIIEENELHRYDKGGKKSEEAPVVAAPERKKEEGKEQSFEATVEVDHRIRDHANDIDYVVAKRGDDKKELIRELELREWQFYKYNDLNPSDKIRPGDVIFLQPKRNRAHQDHHIVEEGETMRQISQEYGVKLKKLYKKNCMIVGTEPEPGQKLSLRKNKRCDNGRPSFFQRLFR